MKFIELRRGRDHTVLYKNASYPLAEELHRPCRKCSSFFFVPGISTTSGILFPIITTVRRTNSVPSFAYKYSRGHSF